MGKNYYLCSERAVHFPYENFAFVPDFKTRGAVSAAIQNVVAVAVLRFAKQTACAVLIFPSGFYLRIGESRNAEVVAVNDYF